MKKVIIVAMLLSLISLASCGEKVATNKVPTANKVPATKEVSAAKEVPATTDTKEVPAAK